MYAEYYVNKILKVKNKEIQNLFKQRPFVY